MNQSDYRGMEALPDELLLQIFGYLDSEPPSLQRLHLEPSLSITTSPTIATLKSLSLISHRWRRIALPTLFKHTRLRLDAAYSSAWSRCPVCGPEGLASEQDIQPESMNGIHRYHIDMVKDALLTSQILKSAREAGPTEQVDDSILPTAVIGWIPEFYHALQDFLVFIQREDIADKVETFVFLTEQLQEFKLDRFPHTTTDRDWRYAASAAFWQHLLSVIDPRAVIIVAPPADLASLTNCAIDTFGDWAFDDMDYHILELTQDKTSAADADTTLEIQYADLKPAPRSYPGVAESSILRLRPWTTVGLNEGSFLKAYGTYEYFERGPPSLIYSIKNCLMPDNRVAHASVSTLPRQTPFRTCLSSMRKFKYTSIFPFATHLQLLPFLLNLEELELQLAPTPAEHGILASKDRVGKAELNDCWSELIGTYRSLVVHVMTSRVADASTDEGWSWRVRNPDVRLKKLICKDFAVDGLRAELEELFVMLHLPIWAEYESGVFTRLM